MFYSVEAESHTLTVAFGHVFFGADCVTIHAGELQGERSCRVVPLDILGQAPSRVVQAWRSHAPSSQVRILTSKKMKVSLGIGDEVEEQRSCLERLLEEHLGESENRITATVQSGEMCHFSMPRGTMLSQTPSVLEFPTNTLQYFEGNSDDATVKAAVRRLTSQGVNVLRATFRSSGKNFALVGIQRASVDVCFKKPDTTEEPNITPKVRRERLAKSPELRRISRALNVAILQ